MEYTTITESGMEFGKFPYSNVFPIEKSLLYRTKFLPYGIKTCEFILFQENRLYFIEAKTNCPNFENAQTGEEKRAKYDAFIQEISQKMRDSLNLYTSLLLKRNDSKELPRNMAGVDLSNIQFRFVLIVKNARPEWLVHYPDKFQSVLRNEMKIWNIPTFAVITEEKARKKHFVL